MNVIRRPLNRVQNSLTRAVSWADIWRMLFNIIKCHHLHIGEYDRGTKYTRISNYQEIELEKVNKSTTSIIPRHSNYLFMYQSYRCENVWKENDGGTDKNLKPDLDNINGQITILMQILIISMHIASLVKRPCYLLKLSSRNENMDVSRADNSVKI